MPITMRHWASRAGYDTVDVAAATARKIPVVYAPVSGFAVAEGALALLLTLVKRIPLCDALVKEGQWQKRYDLSTGDMAEHTLGIMGLGRIGSALAKLVQPFGMTVVGHDPLISRERGRELVLKQAGLELSREICPWMAHGGEPDLPVPVTAVQNGDTAPC